MHRQIIYILLINILPIFLLATENKNIDIKTPASEESFVTDLVHEIHTQLKASIAVSHHFEACLNKDLSWFQIQDTKLKSLEFCQVHLDPTREKIKQRYQLMRLALGIHQFIWLGDSSPKFDDEFTADPKFLSRYIEKDISHPYSNLIDLEPLSDEEVVLATEWLKSILNQRFNKRVHGEYDPENLIDNICVMADLHRRFINIGHKCFKEIYQTLLFGNSSSQFPAEMLLGFVKSSEPNDEELAQVMLKIRENTEELLTKFRSKYFKSNAGTKSNYVLKNKKLYIEDEFKLMRYSNAAQRVLQGNSQYEDYHTTGLELLGKSGLKRLGFEITVMGVWLAACHFSKLGALAKGVCQLPMGLGANYYSYWFENSLFKAPLDIIFYRVDSLNEIGPNLSELNDLEFNKKINFYLLPFFTGVPVIVKESFKRVKKLF